MSRPLQKRRALLWRPVLSIFLLGAAASAQTAISVRVVQGDNAINSIRMRRGHDPVVQVLGQNGQPLPRATVSFLLPASGASGSFGESGLSLTVQTDDRGMAVGRGLVPNRIEGQFRIRVTVSAQGESANAVISQTNAEPAVKSSRSKWIAIAVVAGGAVAGGAAVAAKGGKSTPAAVSGGATGGTTGTGSIVPGTPSFGPPR
jgi:hypothetical protein